MRRKRQMGHQPCLSQHHPGDQQLPYAAHAARNEPAAWPALRSSLTPWSTPGWTTARWLTNPDALRVLFTEYTKYPRRAGARRLAVGDRGQGSFGGERLGGRRLGGRCCRRRFPLRQGWCNQGRHSRPGASMLVLRSLAFNVAFYLNLIVQMILWTPVYFLSPRRHAWFVPKFWSAPACGSTTRSPAPAAISAASRTCRKARSSSPPSTSRSGTPSRFCRLSRTASTFSNGSSPGSRSSAGTS